MMPILMTQAGDNVTVAKITGRSDVNHRSPRRKIREEKFGQVKGGRNPHRQRIGEFVPGTFIDSLHHRQGIIDEIISMPGL